MSARVSMLAAVFVIASSVAAHAADPCAIEITTPQPGDKVGKNGWVRGTATIPNGTHLWILAHLKDLVAEWWPQGGHAAVIAPEDAKWVIRAGYGVEDDVDQQFEVAAVVVDQNTNTRLRDWFKTAKTEGYPPIEFPDSVEGCVPVKVVVNKTSH